MDRQENTSIDHGSRLTSTLRTAGVLMLAASGVIFMLQGVWALSSFERFLSFAGLAAALGILGVGAGAFFREPKTARVFLGLAAAGTPVLYSQLGAIVHAGFSTAPSSIPQALTVAAPTFLAGTIAVCATTALMAPLLYLGFAAFYRQRAQEYVAMMLGGCLLLLIPLRDPVSATFMVLASAGALTWFSESIANTMAPVGEKEQWVAGILPLAPVTILIGRALFYEGSTYFAGSVAVFFAALFLSILPSLTKRESVRASMQGPGILSLAFGWALFASYFAGFLRLGDGIELMLAAYVPALALIAISRRWGNTHWLGSFAAAVLPWVAIALQWTSGMAAFMIVTGALSAALGFAGKRSSIFSSGVMTGIIGLIYFVMQAAHYAFAAPWVSLAVAGIAVIAVAGWLEKNRPRLHYWSTSAREHFDLGPAMSRNERR